MGQHTTALDRLHTTALGRLHTTARDRTRKPHLTAPDRTRIYETAEDRARPLKTAV